MLKRFIAYRIICDRCGKSIDYKCCFLSEWAILEMFRKDGWIIKDEMMFDRECYCPDCAEKRRKKDA